MDISFETFARAVCEMPVIRQDPHWRIQYYQTFQAKINYDFIGRFEQLPSDLRTVTAQIGIDNFITPSTFGTAGKTSRQHATNAASLLRQYYTPELRRIVQKGFAEDFAHFGYSTELPE
ncbi:MAG: sulfotransferase family 2 domain-containing protein [Lewinella sp.]